MKLKRFIKIVIFALIFFISIILLSAFISRGKQDLKVWHTAEFEHEFTSRLYVENFTYRDYKKLEDKLFDELKAKVYQNISKKDQRPYNRFYEKSVLHPDSFPSNWNRSFELIPETIKGGVFLIHGLSDSPYSLRKIAEVFYQQGFYVLCLRMPGHGTAPSGLLTVHYNDWLHAVDIGTRHVNKIIGSNKPFYMGGYSNGGTLTLRYILDAMEGGKKVPDKVFLFSPALGVSPFAFIASWHKTLSFLPYFEKFKWLSILPEYDPFKYNSFPKNAGYQIYRLIKSVKKKINRFQKSGQMKDLPVIITFQSVVDSTVVAQDIITELYDKIDNSESELVLFDINRYIGLEAFIKDIGYKSVLDKHLNNPGLNYNLTIITNEHPESKQVMAFTKRAHDDRIVRKQLSLFWPQGIYSLSHVAIPFSPDDPLYGQRPPKESPLNQTLGSLMPRGENKLLRVPIGQLMRLRYNPFFDYLNKRITSEIPQ
jgi:alpha-beta hydrolase superfamily lysophospholipase